MSAPGPGPGRDRGPAAGADRTDSTSARAPLGPMPPLFWRPGSVALVDDDADYLEMLAMVLPRQWALRLYVRPTRCVYALHRELRHWEADLWQFQHMVELWRQGKPLIPQVLGYWARAQERHALTHVCVVDFCMPGMDGLQLLGELVDWPGARVLLTGQADERVAVHAFNRRLIHQYVPKQDASVAVHLAGTIDALRQRAGERYQGILAATLRPEQQQCLRAPGVAQALTEFTRRHWIEHVLIGEPFGLLGMDGAGRVGWLQLETRQGLAAMAELAQEDGLPAQAVDDIRAGHRLASPELRQALGLRGPAPHLPAIALGDGGELLGALFAVEAHPLGLVPAGYDAWLQRQPPRIAQD